MGGSRQGFSRSELPPVARGVDSWIEQAVAYAWAEDDSAVEAQAFERHLAALDSGRRPLAQRVLADAGRAAVEATLPDGVDAEALGDLVVLVVGDCRQRGIEVDTELLIVVLTGLFGLAPTREELDAVVEDEVDSDSAAQARRLLWALDRQLSLTRHAVLLLATLSPNRKALRQRLDRTWIEMVREQENSVP